MNKLVLCDKNRICAGIFSLFYHQLICTVFHLFCGQVLSETRNACEIKSFVHQFAMLAEFCSMVLVIILPLHSSVVNLSLPLASSRVSKSNRCAVCCVIVRCDSLSNWNSEWRLLFQVSVMLICCPICKESPREVIFIPLNYVYPSCNRHGVLLLLLLLFIVPFIRRRKASGSVKRKDGNLWRRDRKSVTDEWAQGGPCSCVLKKPTQLFTFLCSQQKFVSRPIPSPTVYLALPIHRVILFGRVGVSPKHRCPPPFFPRG